MVDLAQLKKSVRLTASLDELRRMYDKLADVLNGLGDAEQQCMLLIMERMVLGDLGHKCTIKFGKNSWNGQNCCICGVPLEQEGRAVWLISRWENTSVMLCLCDEHAHQAFEVDVDLLTGKFTSKIGLP
jgi:hypothetical protein